MEIAFGDRPFVLILGESSLDLGEGRHLVAFQQYTTRGMDMNQVADLLTGCLNSVKEGGESVEDPS